VFPSFQTRVADARHCGDLYFATLLPQETIQRVFGEASQKLDSARVYNTAITVWTFLTQALSIHHACTLAVTKLNVYRIASGLRGCSTNTGAYCIARDKLDEDGMHRLVTHTGEAVDKQAPEAWRWKDRRVIAADGATVTMADTPENQAAYPQQKQQRRGCGFPIMRLVAFFSLASGVALEVAMGKYKGKLTAEVSLFREIDHIIGENDVFLGDRCYSGWFDVARLMGRGADVVVRKHQARKTDFRRGIRYGKEEHAVHWDKPQRPPWMSEEEYATYPDSIILRELKVRVATPGFRTRELIIVTSLLDDIEYDKEAIADLYRRRWQAELNLRSLKTVMQMDHLRCKTPHRVRNELRAHLAAYNLIRQVMCEAAMAGGVVPWHISFKGALTTLVETLPVLAAIPDADTFCRVLFECCLTHVVGHRPDRYEPRVVKRRPKSYKLMNKPRRSYKPGNE